MAFVKNRDELLDVPEKYRKIREILIGTVESAISSVHPDTVIPENVALRYDELIIGKKDFEIRGRLAVFGMGKASYHMAKAVHKVLGERIDMGIVNSIKDEKVGNMEVKRASHPFPDEKTVENTEKAVEMAKDLKEGDMAIVLISGGGSSMFCLPPEGVSIKDIRWISEEMMRKGADIWELNTVRRSISMVKGGKFAGYIRPAKVVSLIISDVVDNHLPSIASGPTVETGFEGKEAERILRKYDLWDDLPESVKAAVRTERKGESADMNLIIADNRMAVNHASLALTAHGVDHTIFHGIKGDVAPISKEISGMVMAAVMGGETTAVVRGNGRGGRNQELVLRALKNGFGGSLVAIGTDGMDGNSEYAGAIGDGHTVKRALSLGLDMDDFLENSDSSSFFERVGGAIETGYTGTNVADIIIVIPGHS